MIGFHAILEKRLFDSQRYSLVGTELGITRSEQCVGVA